MTVIATASTLPDAADLPTSPDPAGDPALATRARYTRVMATIAAISGSAALLIAAAGLVVISH